MGKPLLKRIILRKIVKLMRAQKIKKNYSYKLLKEECSKKITKFISVLLIKLMPKVGSTNMWTKFTPSRSMKVQLQMSNLMMFS